MPLSPPTFVLVPGTWHTTTHMQPLIDALTQNQYRAKTIQLASVGLKTLRPRWQDEVQIIYEAVSGELQAGEDVCLVLHSYAGMPGAEAVDRLVADGVLDASQESERGKLTRVVFIAAYVFPTGVVMDARQFFGPENPDFSIDDEGICHQANPYHNFFNDLPFQEAAQPWTDTLEPAYYLGQEPVISSEAWRKAPVTAFLCKRDNAVPPSRQEMIWQGVESEWIDAGHTPYVSQPEKVAEILIRLAVT